MTYEDEVIRAFDIVLEQVEDTIEELNQDGAKAFGKGDYDQARKLMDQGSQMTAFRGKVNDLQKEWGKIFGKVRARKQRRKGDEQAPKRLGRGLRTREDAFRIPILQALVQLGGSAQSAKALDTVGELMQDQLNEYDRSPLPSTPDSIRWRNTAQWARNAMVKEGLLASDSPRGTWAISKQGRQWLKAQTK